ncbi:hypothetical protein NXY18_06450 [Bacteroides faecis]|nr:hypothetical protein [Bacteroides faecis]UVQ61012.1 hypothetical protein NXY18_06450 [Bacteroides faecis]DAP90540.1 MAG TPA: hypothetical protein [Caudoviricetes sp.]
MESRFNQQKANLRSYLRNRGAEIDVKRKTIRIEIDSLNQKELGKLEELKRWGYQVNEDAPPPSLHLAILSLKMIHLYRLRTKLCRCITS